MNIVTKTFIVSWVLLPIWVTAAFGDNENFQKALSYTYINSPDLIIARRALENTSESLVQAQGALYPSASLSTSSQRSYSTNNSDFDTYTDTNTIRLTGDYNLYSSGRISSKIKASKEAIKVAKFKLKFQEQQILLGAIKAYLDVIRDRKLLEISKNNLMVIQEQVDATKNRFALGSATRTDLAEREAAFEAAKADLSAREGSVTASEQIYLTRIGLVPDTNIDVPSGVQALPENLDEALSLGNSQHPLILAAQAELKQSRENYKQLRAARGLNITISGAIQNSDSALSKGNTGNIGISASIPIFSGGSLVSQQRQGALLMENAQVMLTKQKREVEQNIEISWKNLQVSEATVEARVLQVASSGLAYDGIKREYDLGARSNLELNTAEQNFLRSRSDLASAERDVTYAIYNLVAAIGKLTPKYLELEISPTELELSDSISRADSAKQALDVDNKNPLREIINSLGSLLD